MEFVAWQSGQDQVAAYEASKFLRATNELAVVHLG